jgi:hypothetical protein
MPSDDVHMIGAANFKARTRTNKSGATKTRYTVEVSGDTILTNTDPKSLGKGPAEAIAAVIKERISSISATASQATIRARAVAAKAFAAGEQWAVKRYSGGRTGPMPPNQSNRAFNDSGRLAASIAVGAQSESYVINFAANRWDPTQVKGGEAGLARIFDMLKTHVPELADARRLLDSIPVRKAIRDGLAAAIQKADERTVELKKQRMSAAIGIARAALSLVA